MLALLALFACGDAPDTGGPAPGAWSALEREQIAALRRVDAIPPSPGNAVADDPRAARLGAALFYDAGLSPSGAVSCATCHRPELHFTDGRLVGQGVGLADRHTPTIEGTQWGPWFFWDGRADSLWAQSLGPIENPAEMASDRVFVARYVLSAHRAEYEAIFGAAPVLDALPARATPNAPEGSELKQAWEALSDAERRDATAVFVNVGKAIEAFERRLLPGDAAFDRYADALAAGDVSGGGHLDAAAVEGLSLFLREGRCVSCHHGPMFTDRAFHTLGLPEPRGYDQGRTFGATSVLKGEFSCGTSWSDAKDCPELRYLDPAFQDFRGAFKTPTLRNVTRTAPYMHNGALASIDDVLEFYSTLPAAPLVGHRELTLQPLDFDHEQRQALKAFLRSLEGPPVPPELSGAPPREGG